VQRFDALPLGRAEVADYSRDMDGDGLADAVIENQRVRVSFSGADGRWMEWVWKDSNTNLLPESGLWSMPGPVTVPRWEAAGNSSRTKPGG